jgi:hypothetical protein
MTHQGDSGPRILVNAVLYEGLWVACVVGGLAAGLPVAVLFLVVHFGVLKAGRSDVLLIAVSALTGIVVDSALMHLGVFDFPGGETWLCPPWIIVIWAMFGLTLDHCLRWARRSLPLAAVVGAVAGPLSYMGGERLGGVRLQPALSLPPALWLAVVWAMVFPGLAWISGRIAARVKEPGAEDTDTGAGG